MPLRNSNATTLLPNTHLYTLFLPYITPYSYTLFLHTLYTFLTFPIDVYLPSLHTFPLRHSRYLLSLTRITMLLNTHGMYESIVL